MVGIHVQGNISSVLYIVTGNLPQLNDPTMISVGTQVMVMLLLQYSQSDMHKIDWKRESIVVLIRIVTQMF